MDRGRKAGGLAKIGKVREGEREGKRRDITRER
uniref:Uncharacterized protein n=1 Tax=Tetraselmis sp. GSL018 TaxID=582737 RepID=A0A061S890_9CHLO